MKSYVWIFGLIAGGLLGGMMVITMPMYMNQSLDFDHGEILGYSTMVLAFLLVFFGIRSYRDKAEGGTITFGRAFKVGILITLVACGVYVATWQVLYFGFMPDFPDVYAAHLIEKMRADGATAQQITEKQQEMAKFRDLYRNPLINAGVTFLEVFPVGLITTLVSAAILRRRAPATGKAVVTA